MDTFMTGLQFMLIGMTGVFVFLVIMVLSMNLLKTIVRVLKIDGDNSSGNNAEQEAVAAAYALHLSANSNTTNVSGVSK